MRQFSTTFTILWLFYFNTFGIPGKFMCFKAMRSCILPSPLSSQTTQVLAFSRFVAVIWRSLATIRQSVAIGNGFLRGYKRFGLHEPNHAS